MRVSKNSIIRNELNIEMSEHNFFFTLLTQILIGNSSVFLLFDIVKVLIYFFRCLLRNLWILNINGWRSFDAAMKEI